jgi:nucleoside-diphosphate-sugar epimerase
MIVMKLLVLGGTHFAGRAVVEAAVAAGTDVTMLNRGRATIPGHRVRTLVADRTDQEALRAALADGEWDVVVDTWSEAPLVVAQACELLADRAGHFVYISTVSVYAEPIPMNAGEHAPTVDGDPDGMVGVVDYTTYPAAKRGAELAVVRAFGDDRALLARPGLIIGPYENAYRLPWWLRRMERGGQVLAPGDPARPLQYIDVRDMADWVLSAAQRRLAGAFNVISRPGHTTMSELLTEVAQVTGGAAELVWVPQDRILEAGIAPWTELPIWLPSGPEYDAEDSIDVSAAFAAGLKARPVRETVAGAWAWLQAEGDPAPRPNRPRIGLDPVRERAVLDAYLAASS